MLLAQLFSSLHFSRQHGHQESFIQCHYYFFLYCKYIFYYKKFCSIKCVSFDCFDRIIFIKRLVAYYFQRKLNNNSKKLNDLRAEKKKIIEKVMDKETYKVALDILNRFADPATRFQQQSITSTNGIFVYGYLYC